MIDPVILGGVINDLATMETAITTELKGLKTEFEKVGVTAQPINDLVTVSHWLHGELPMLRRRHAAAVLLESQGMMFYPGTKMLAMPEDPTLATKQAGELAAKRIRDGLDAKPPSKYAIVDAAKALRQLTARNGKLTPDELTFLQALYGGLGRTVYKLPEQLGDDKATKSTIVDGLLLLSNEKLGGGFDKLPAEIRQDVRSTSWTYWNSPGGKDRTPPGQGFHDLATFLQNQDPNSKNGPGKELALGLAHSVADEFRMKDWLHDEYGSTKTGPPSDMKNNVYLDMGQAQDMLSLVSRNHNADAELMGDRNFLAQTLAQDWPDDGKAMAKLTNWAAKAAIDPANPEYKLAKDATADLINIVTTNQDGPDQQMFKVALDGAKDNPEIARTFSRLVAANIADFGEDDPNSTTATSTNGDLEIPTDRRNRLAMLGAMDPQGRAIMHIAAEAHKMETLGAPHPDSEAARRTAAIDGIVTAAGHNALYYDNLDAADSQNKTRAAAFADDQAVDSVLRKFYDTAAGLVPGGPVIGLTKDALATLLEDGLELPEPEPVLPGKVSTDGDATGVHVPEARAAHDLAQARLRADTNGAAGLRPDMFTPGADGHPKLKDLSEMTGTQRATLRTWAEKNGGGDYMSTYGDGFSRTYTQGEKVEDGPAVLKDFVEASTAR